MSIEDNKSNNFLCLTEDDQKNRKIESLATGFRDLDHITLGLHPGELVVIGGKSIGKTSFATSLLLNMAVRDKTSVSYFSLAETNEHVTHRLLASEANVNIRDLAQGKLNENEWSKFTQAAGSLQHAPIYLYDEAKINVAEIYRCVEEIIEKEPDKPHVAFVDHLSLVVPDSEQNRYEQIDHIVRELKFLAREHECVVVLVSNLSRNYDRRVEHSQDNRPKLSDLRDSGTIEEYADTVFLLHRDLIWDEEEFPKIYEILIAKQKYGTGGIVELAFVGEYSKFIELDKPVHAEF